MVNFQESHFKRMGTLIAMSAHISQAVPQALRNCGLRYVVIPGGLTMFIQSIDTALAALYRSAHHRLHVSCMEHQAKLTVAQQRDLFVEFCYSGLTAATANLDVPPILWDLGYINPSKAKLRIPYRFAPPEVQPQNVAAAKPKPKPKAGARHLSMATFLARK